MDEYIKRNAAIDSVKAEMKHRNGTLDYNAGLLRATENLETLPAADVVEVVRCKNCKNRYLWLFCGYFGDEDYCPKGAKMDGGMNDAAD